MTITINQSFVYYWAFTVIFEAVYGYITCKMAWNKFKKNAEYIALFNMTIESFKQSTSLKYLWSIIYSPLGFFIGFVFLLMASPVLFIFSLITLFKNLIGYKSKLQKKAEEEGKKFEEAKKRSEEFMKNEGRETYFADEIPEPPPINPN